MGDGGSREEEKKVDEEAKGRLAEAEEDRLGFSAHGKWESEERHGT